MANESNIKDELKVLFKEHDYNQLYYKQDIVTYQINGTTNFYQAIRNVPRYVPITDRRYWNQLNVSEGSAEGSTPTGDADNVDYLCFTAETDGATLNLKGMCTPSVSNMFNLEYSTDKINWQELEFVVSEVNGFCTVQSSTITFEKDDKVYFRGDNINGSAYTHGDMPQGPDDPYPDTYVYVFSTDNDDSKFAVSGDLQTIVNKTGEDKEHGIFSLAGMALFANSASSGIPGVTITTAPDLTATTLLPMKYTALFNGQTELTKPANMPSFTTSDLPSQGGIGVGCFVYMYKGCTSLEEPADFNGLTVTSDEDITYIDNNLQGIYADTTFDITNDNGETLNGFGSISRITNNFQTKGSYYIANTLGNTEGFTYRCVDTLASSPSNDDVFCTITATSEYPIEDIIIENTTRHVILGATGGETVTLHAYCIEGYGVSGWYKKDGNSWVSMHDTFTGTPPVDRHYTKEILLPTENIIDSYRPSPLIIK